MQQRSGPIREETVRVVLCVKDWREEVRTGNRCARRSTTVVRNARIMDLRAGVCGACAMCYFSPPEGTAAAISTTTTTTTKRYGGSLNVL